jgi:hypothetical protein
MDNGVIKRARVHLRPGRYGGARTFFPAMAFTAVGLVATPAAAHLLRFTQVWSVGLADRGSPVALSSPNVATLEGQPAVVVGDRAGRVYALSLANGRALPGWPVNVGGPVDSTPSVAALNKAGASETVFVGVGNSARPRQGRYEAIGNNGAPLWSVTVKNPPTDLAPALAVQASLAVGYLQGTTAVVAPSLGQEEYAITAGTGRTLPGFPWFTSDSGFSTPALADLYGDGQTEIIEGGDQSAGVANGVRYRAGGHVRVIAPTGNYGSKSPAGGLQCQYNTDQVVQSSPAVGPFLAGGAVGIVVGTGKYWPDASSTDKILALGKHCNLVWQATLDGYTTSSPALADLLGNGALEVVEGTNNGSGGGSVYALSGPNGSVLWRQPVGGEVIGSVVTADLGRAYQDVIVPTTHGAEVLDGRSGRLLASLAPFLGLQNSPLVTDDPDGKIGIILAGYDGHDTGTVLHFEVAGSDGSRADEVGAWPMFHHDPQLTGNAGVPPSAKAARAQSRLRAEAIGALPAK